MKQTDIWDLLDTGAEVIDKAVQSGDFSHLEKTIRQAVQTGAQTIRRASASVKTAMPEKPRRLYGSTGGKLTGGILKLVFGGILAVTCTVLMGVFSFINGFSGAMIPGCALGGVLIGAGAVDVTFVGRYKTYRRILGEKTTAALDDLADGVGKSVRFVKKDLRRMFGAGYFLEGHLDHEGVTLITSHETYRQFEQHRKLLEQRRAEAPKPASPVQEVLDKGDRFLAEIRRCNDRIPGEVVSAKISRMELLVERIFDRAERHPEVVPDLKKLLDYYLPMTVKLLNAYADMDAQPVQGENITASKREIEGTLDTLNLAFEKLLDQIFQDAAWDVSSDISVLNTLLAQEGLTEDELTGMQRSIP